MENIKNIILSNPTYIWLLVILGIILFVIAIFYREKNIVKKAVYNGIVLAEKKFNSGEGQQKLEFATDYVKQQLPTWLRFLVTKKLIVTIIEFVLDKTSDIFQLDYDVDIIGNEKTVETNFDLNEINKSLKAEIKTSKKINPVEKQDWTGEIYGKIVLDTDFHSNPDVRAEIGFIKKF